MTAHGTYATIDGRPAIRFERRLAHPVEAVWAAVTDPGELAHWFPCAVDIGALEAGAPLRFTFEDGTEYTGEVLEARRPHAFAFTWGPDRLRFEIEADGEGSVLRLVHVLYEEGPDAAARTMAGWHLCLDTLPSVLDGAPVDAAGGGTAAWQPIYDEYVARGVPAGAPIPGA